MTSADIVSRTDLSDRALTNAVLASLDGAADARFETVIRSLVTHLHAFAGDVQLTEGEWLAGIEFLTRTGHITDGRRQEFVLLSDVLGLSMLVVGINARRPPGATESTVLGPFFVPGAPLVENGEDISSLAAGQPCHVSGRVRSLSGGPIAGARIDVWQTDEDGYYDVQYADLDTAQGRAHLFSAEDGRYSFWSVLPVPYPIPDDGPVGTLLAAAGRGPMRPAHIHFRTEVDGYEDLITHVFAAGDEYLGSDAVFGVKRSLIAPFVRHEPGTAPDGRRLDVPFFTMTFDLVLAPSQDGQEPSRAAP